jgi:hypothetical protein
MEKIDEYEINAANLSDVPAINYPGKLPDEVDLLYNDSTDEIVLVSGRGHLLDRGCLEDYEDVSDIEDFSKEDVINELEPGNGTTIIGPSSYRNCKKPV